MNTQMERPRGHSTHDQDDPLLHTNATRSGEGHQETEHHGEKKSVLKKVKDKAKKIKDTVTGHHHDHDHDHDHNHDDEMHTDPGVHGVQSGHSFVPVPGEMNTAPLPTSKPAAHVETFDPRSTKLYSPRQDVDPNLGHSGIEKPGDFQTFDPSTARYVPGQDETLGHSRTNTGRPTTGITSKPGDFQTFDPSTARYVPKEETFTHSRTDTGRPKQGDLHGFGKEGAFGHSGVDIGRVKQGDFEGFGKEGTFDHGRTKQSDLHGFGKEGTFGHSGADIGRVKQGDFESFGEKGTFGQEGMFGHDTRRPKQGDFESFGEKGTFGQSKSDTGRHVGFEERPYAPRNTPVGAHIGGGSRASGGIGVGERGISEEIGGVMERSSMEEDPNSPKRGFAPERHQATVTDPTGKGAEEIGITPILHRLDRMHIQDESDKQEQENPTTGEQEETLFKPSSAHYEMPPSTGTHDQFSPEPEPEPESDQTHGTYTEKVSTAAYMVADKAKQATNIVTSKLAEYTGATQEGSLSNKVVTAVQDKVGPVFGKVAEAGSTLASSGPRTEPELEEVKVPGDKGVSVKEYLAEKLRPGEEDRALSELITEKLGHQEGGSGPGSDSGSGLGSPGKAVLDKIKGAATSLFGKGGDPNSSPTNTTRKTTITISSVGPDSGASEGPKNDSSVSGY